MIQEYDKIFKKSISVRMYSRLVGLTGISGSACCRAFLPVDGDDGERLTGSLTIKGIMIKSIRFLIIAVVFFAFFLPMPLFGAGNWEKTEEDPENDILVYTRSVEHSPIKEYKGKTTVTASLDALVSLMADVESFSRWMHNVECSRTLERISDTERIIYVAQGVPWPMSNRDLVLHSKLRVDPDTRKVTIDVEARPEAYPEQEGYFRIRKMTSTWQFAPKQNGKVEVVYVTHVDPGGNIPHQLVNAHTLDTPLNSLRGLREMIQKPEYSEALMDVLHEP